MEEAIREFDGTDHDFLSNFHPARVEYEGITYPTSEHAYQAAKTLDTNIRLIAKNIKTPGDVKRWGRIVDVRKDWDTVKYGVMYDIVYLKFTQNLNLADRLVATGNAHIEEGNNWGDRLWGVSPVGGYGKNWLGQILMRVRAEIRIEQSGATSRTD